MTTIILITLAAAALAVSCFVAGVLVTRKHYSKLVKAEEALRS
jgi:hypothetical protein